MHLKKSYLKKIWFKSIILIKKFHKFKYNVCLIKQKFSIRALVKVVIRSENLKGRKPRNLSIKLKSYLILREKKYFYIISIRQFFLTKSVINKWAKKNLAKLNRPCVTFQDLWGHTHLYEKWVSLIMLAFINSFDKIRIQTKIHEMFSMPSKVTLYFINKLCLLIFISSFDVIRF